MGLHDTGPPAKTSQTGLYIFLLASETLGAVLLFSEGLPIYRKTLADPASYDPHTTAVALSGAALIQIAYWLGYRIRPEPPHLGHAVLAHIVLFVARLVFTVPTTIFAFLFVTKAVIVQMPVSKYAFILFALFSIFCYVRELERLGARLLLRNNE